jgi:hypothetical protein
MSDSFNFSVPNLPIEKLKTINQQNLADQFQKRLLEMVYDFESNLDQEHEVGMRLVSFGQTVSFHVNDIGYYNPSLITFSGILENGSPVELIQHVSQISFLLMSVPKLDPEKPPKRIGFVQKED